MPPLNQDTPLIEILVVDDDRSALRELRLFLERRGYQIHTAETGEIAVQIVAATKIDFILSDIRMPGMSIQEMIAAIRLHTPDVPIALMTGQPAAGHRLDAEELDVKSILRKPLSLREVSSMIDDALAK